MYINPTLAEEMISESTENNNTNRQLSNIIRAGTAPVIICYGETPPEYEDEMLTYIDTPPIYEEPQSIVAVTDNGVVTIKLKQKKPKTNPNPKPKNKEEDSLSKRKGKCCYSRESYDSRCCGACYWLCPSKTVEDQCEFCHNNFCDYWKSGYIQTMRMR